MPIKNREDMERSLQKGKEILSIRPELFDMSLSDILNELADGTSEMLQDRWGVAAHVVVAAIRNYDTMNLVPKLAEYEDIGFTCEYVGFLLLTEHNVNLEGLLLEAGRQELLDRIAPFVCPNLQYETEFYDRILRDLLRMLELHTNPRTVSTIIDRYADHIASLRKQNHAAEVLGDLVNQAEFSFMHAIARSWYEDNRDQAGKYCGKLLDFPGLWSRKAGIDFLEVSLRECETDFLHYYSKVNQMIHTEPELWIASIPLFVRYILDYDHTSENEKVYESALRLLQTVPDGSLDERRSFLLALQWKEISKASIEELFQSVICHPFDKDPTVLNVLDTCLYRKLLNEQEDALPILCTLFTAFSASGFLADFPDFFSKMHSVLHHLSQHMSPQITAAALNYMLAGGSVQLFFGIGLLSEAGNIPKLFQERKNFALDFPEHLTNEQLIYLMKGLLYYVHDSNEVCITAFQLLSFAKEPCREFIQFCLNEVFIHYPGTMYSIASRFKTDGTDLQIRLAKQIEQAYLLASDALSESREIKDIAPSPECWHIYQHAQEKLMNQVNATREKSFILDLFPSRVLKYGAKIGHVIHGQKGQLFYQVSTPAHISHQTELSAEYINDPVQFEIKRNAYLKEVRSRAADHQGLPAAFKREG